MYEYSAKLIHVVDGDTVDLEVDLGFNTILKDRFRLSGIDTPELKSPVAEERLRAHEARLFVENALKDKKLFIKTEKDNRDKYGRYLAWIFLVDPKDGDTAVAVNQKLINAGLAKAYDGGKR